MGHKLTALALFNSYPGSDSLDLVSEPQENTPLKQMPNSGDGLFDFLATELNDCADDLEECLRRVVMAEKQLVAVRNSLADMVRRDKLNDLAHHIGGLNENGLENYIQNNYSPETDEEHWGLALAGHLLYEKKRQKTPPSQR